MKTYPLILFTVAVLLPLAHGAGGAFITAWLDSVGIKYVPPVTPTTTPTPNSDPKCTDCSKTDQGRLFWGIFGKDPPLPCCTVECTCGIEGNTVTRIVGGAPSVNGKYPWLGAFNFGSNDGSTTRGECAGTLVAANWVVTAASCIVGILPPVLPALPAVSNAGIANMSVVFGEYDLGSSTDNFDTKRKNVKLALEPIVHEMYTGNKEEGHDIALLKLAEAVDLKVYTPACLPKSDADYTGQKGQVYGWGAQALCPLPPILSGGILHEVEMPIVSDAVCNAASNPAVAVFDLTTQQCATEAIDYSGKISSEMVCAGETGKGACLGDGGNPLTVKSDSTNQHDLVGVGSWNKGCAADGLFGVYAEVAQLRTWMDEKIAANGGATFCSS